MTNQKESDFEKKLKDIRKLDKRIRHMSNNKKLKSESLIKNIDKQLDELKFLYQYKQLEKLVDSSGIPAEVQNRFYERYEKLEKEINNGNQL